MEWEIFEETKTETEEEVVLEPKEKKQDTTDGGGSITETIENLLITDVVGRLCGT